MSSILNNDNFVSVLPRIIDPGMKFTKESILNSNIKNTTESVISAERESIPQKQLISDTKESLDRNVSTYDIDNKQSQKSNSFLSDYKYIILIVIISIVIIIIAYLIYKYFDNKNNQKKIEVNTNKEEVKLLDNAVSTCGIDKGVKDDNVKEYISNYIINDDENDDGEEDTNNEEEDNEDINNEEEDSVENIIEEIEQNNVEIIQTNYNINREPINTPIIQKPTSITNTVLSIDSNVMIDSQLSTYEINNNLNANSDKNIYGMGNENLESENIDSFLNSLDGDNDSDSDDIPIFEDLGYESENSNINEELKEFDINKLDDIPTNEVEDDDDLKYFKKFTKK